MKSENTTKNEQLKLPEVGQFSELPNPPDGWKGWVKAITSKRFTVKLVKRQPQQK